MSDFPTEVHARLEYGDDTNYAEAVRRIEGGHLHVTTDAEGHAVLSTGETCAGRQTSSFEVSVALDPELAREIADALYETADAAAEGEKFAEAILRNRESDDA